MSVDVMNVTWKPKRVLIWNALALVEDTNSEERDLTMIKWIRRRKAEWMLTSPTWHERAKACADLASFGYSPRTVKVLISAVGYGNTTLVDCAAIKALGELRHPSVVLPLISYLGLYGEDRREASLALAKAGEPQWQELVKGDDEDFIRLARCGDPRVLPALLTALVDRGQHKEAVIEAFLHLGPATVDPLIQALNSSKWEVRCSAIEVLGALHDPRAVGPIIKMITDSDLGVRCCAARELGKFSDPSAVTALMNAFAVDPSIRECAAWALGELKARAAVEMLCQALKYVYGTEIIRRSAAEALGKIGDPDATVPLFNALSDDDHATCAIAARSLVSLANPLAIEMALKYLNEFKSLQDRKITIPHYLLMCLAYVLDRLGHKQEAYAMFIQMRKEATYTADQVKAAFTVLDGKSGFFMN
jgi:hypothetical protein